MQIKIFPIYALCVEIALNAVTNSVTFFNDDPTVPQVSTSIRLRLKIGHYLLFGIHF
jgi:hypothetical protein